MAEFPALPLWTDVILADTMHLDAKETGAYLMLLISAWRTDDCGLPNVDKKLARMARCSMREWASIKEEVLSFWFLKDEKWYQKKLLKVRATVKDKSDKAKRAADAKWLKTKGSDSASASPKHMPQGCQPKPKPKPKPSKKEDTNVSPKESFPFDEITVLWNDRFAGTRIPKVVSLNDTRKKNLKRRFKDTFENNLDFVAQTFDKIKAAPHLMGETGDWNASFDWVMKPANIIKILEGNYDAKSNNSFSNSPNGGTSAVAARNQIVAELEEEQRKRSSGGGNQSGMQFD